MIKILFLLFPVLLFANNNKYLNVSIDSGLEKLNVICCIEENEIYIPYINEPIEYNNNLKILEKKIQNIYIKNEIYRNPVIKIKNIFPKKIKISGYILNPGKYNFYIWKNIKEFINKNSLTTINSITIIGNRKIKILKNDFFKKKGVLPDIKEIIIW